MPFLILMFPTDVSIKYLSNGSLISLPAGWGLIFGRELTIIES